MEGVEGDGCPPSPTSRADPSRRRAGRLRSTSPSTSRRCSATQRSTRRSAETVIPLLSPTRYPVGTRAVRRRGGSTWRSSSRRRALDRAGSMPRTSTTGAAAGAQGISRDGSGVHGKLSAGGGKRLSRSITRPSTTVRVHASITRNIVFRRTTSSPTARSAVHVIFDASADLFRQGAAESRAFAVYGSLVCSACWRSGARNRSSYRRRAVLESSPGREAIPEGQYATAPGGGYESCGGTSWAGWPRCARSSPAFRVVQIAVTLVQNRHKDSDHLPETAAQERRRSSL